MPSSGSAAAPSGGTIPIEIHGSTVVDVDPDGLVTRWRDYFDLHQIDDQVAAHTAPTPD